MSDYYNDPDPEETQDWLESLKGVIAQEGALKADHLLGELTQLARAQGVDTSPGIVSAYTNTIPPGKGERIPGDSLIARNVAAYVRWNAMAMVARANKEGKNLGGHIASFSSSSALYEVGFNWFFHGPDAPDGQDLIYFQGHSAPGMYARAYVEGRLTEEHLENFRKEVGGKGLSSYPHPWLMPDFWQFPTVSMGLGPLMSIYQARFMRYLEAQGHIKPGNKKIWVFMGDGESDEPESRGALSLAARDHLDNLIFVVNCNLQRLDGPVRGNGKIVQELEGTFRGAGWHVIKVLWGTEWDDLMVRDTEGLLLKKLTSMVDGEFQTIRARGPEYLRKTIFGDDPRLLALVEDKTDKELWQMSRGGHDPRKIYEAFAAAAKHQGSPTVILAQTVKGFGLGQGGEASMGAHNLKKMDLEALKAFRDRFHVPLKDDELEALPFIKPPKGSPEALFLERQRTLMGGPVPARIPGTQVLPIPGKEVFEDLYASSGTRELSTTMAFVRLLSKLTRDKGVGKYIVPIIPDEARTFGMEGLFRQLGIYAPTGQLYEPQDAAELAWYKEAASGQILEEGITEAGAISSWIAAGTSYANYGVPLIPFYTYYSMFGFQRIGDFAWAAGDSRARGFLMGATSGRTTLNGEGLQHQDGHGHLLAATLPTCRAYDPTFSYELAAIIRDGMKRMYVDQEDVFYYITLMNENYPHPEMPDGAEEGIIQGMYLFKGAKESSAASRSDKKAQKAPASERGLQVQLMGSGTILLEVIAAGELLEKDFGIAAEIWSIPGINQLHREGMSVERWNMLHPEEEPRIPYATQVMSGHTGPIIISTDYIRAYPEQIRRLLPSPVTVLGTDGYGRSDMRDALRSHFEIDRYHIVLAAVKALADLKLLEREKVREVLETYKLATDLPDPLTV